MFFVKNCQRFLWILFLAFGTLLLVEGMGAADEAVYDAYGKRDPFAPIVTSTAKEAAGLIGIDSVEDISIEGIVYDPKQGSIAIVNGAVLREQEESGAVKVLKIKTDGVLFLINGVERFKSIHPDDSNERG